MKAFLREFLAILVIATIILLLAQATVPGFDVHGSSMEPNLYPGQRLLISKVVYKFHEPERGDVIVFSNPKNPDEAPYIKRIVGLPGETIEIKDGVVYINGLGLDEPYTKDPPNYTFHQYIIPADNYFVLGDNRNNSADSHEGWTVSRQDIIGKAWLLTWPPSEWGLAPNYSPTLTAAGAMSR